MVITSNRLNPDVGPGRMVTNCFNFYSNLPGEFLVYTSHSTTPSLVNPTFNAKMWPELQKLLKKITTMNCSEMLETNELISTKQAPKDQESCLQLENSEIMTRKNFKGILVRNENDLLGFLEELQNENALKLIVSSRFFF